MPDRFQRTGYLLLVVVVGHVILISTQVNSRSGASALEAVTFGVFAEMQRAMTLAASGIGLAWASYIELHGARQENAVLRRNVAALELRLQEQRALAQRTRSLQRLLKLRESVELKTVSARVIAADATPWFRTLTIDQGTGDGLRADFAVIAPRGVVGRVVGVPGVRASKVQLLIDRNAAAGALIERTRAAGVVMGSDDATALRMAYVSNFEDVRVGDVVVTSGIDQVYPKGFVIGHVGAVKPGSGLYKAIQVDSVVDFSKLEDVLVVIVDDPSSAVAAGVE